MRRAIAVYALVALALLAGLDRLWPVWPVHVLAGGLAVIVVAMA